jgi:hypothetical protein
MLYLVFMTFNTLELHAPFKLVPIVSMLLMIFYYAFLFFETLCL